MAMARAYRRLEKMQRRCPIQVDGYQLLILTACVVSPKGRIALLNLPDFAAVRSDANGVRADMVGARGPRIGR